MKLDLGIPGRNGWTGGQYSLFRSLFAAYLFVHFASLVPWAAEVFSNAGVLPDRNASPLLKLFPNLLAIWDPPGVAVGLAWAGVVLSLFFGVGKWDRWAAIGIWYVLTCFFGRNPLTSNPSLPFVGWMLIAHAFLPRAPYGSLEARNRIDPRGDWSFPPAIFGAAWIVMAVAYSYSGITKLVSPSWVDGTAMERVLENPLARPVFWREWLLSIPPSVLAIGTWGALVLELGFVGFAISGRLRPWLWTAMLGMHFGLMTLIDFVDLSFGMVILHLFTFDPRWVPARSPSSKDTLFFDGQCGLCHRWVRLILAEDENEGFRFAPLQSERFRKCVPSNRRESLSQTLVVLTEDGRFLSRSSAVLYILTRLGGFWRILSSVASLVPRPFRDGVYRGIASIRHRLFAPPSSACPLLPEPLRKRFDLGSEAETAMEDE